MWTLGIILTAINVVVMFVSLNMCRVSANRLKTLRQMKKDREGWDIR